MHLSISAAANFIGVSISTLRRWDRDGSFEPDYLTVGRHRRYSISSLKIFCSDRTEYANAGNERKTVLYSRVSSSDQKEDLVRQTERLREHSWDIQIHLLLKILGVGLTTRSQA